MTPEQFSAYCRRGLVQAQALLPKLLVRKSAQEFLHLYNSVGVHLEASGAAAGLIQSVHPKEAFREIARDCEQDVSKFQSELSRNRPIYNALARIDVSLLDAAGRRLVAHSLRDFRRAGVDRDDATRARLKQLDEQLTALGQQFSKNITEDVRHITVEPKQLEGLPLDYIKAHSAGEDGKVQITTNYPDLIPFMNYAISNEARRDLYIASRSRGGEENERILRDILQRRHEKARLLGYRSWADYVTEDKMMKSASNAADFIEKVVRAADTRAKKDYAELLEYKQRTDSAAAEVEDFEKSFLSNRVKKESYAFDTQEVRPYFPYHQVEKGLLEITAAIYDIAYNPVVGPDVWHPSVKAFDVVRGDTPLGRIYLDMHPREGKYKHAAQFTKQSGVLGKQLPEGVLVCNFPNPAEGNALMEHTQVVTMFHEFGHLMHHVLGGQQVWIDQSGVATEWDFVEAPSQMFEEWAWNYETLRHFAKHVETGAVIPKDLVERMRRADKFGIGIGTKQQMYYASISLNFHNTDPSQLNMMEEVKRLQARYTPFRFVEGTRFHANFGHLEGYSALYYTYMWSLVIAKDLLTPFHVHGLMDPEWNKRYRDTILAPGGTQDAAELVRAFLGREFNFDAFERYLSE